ncbi:MAG TPA: hypothetical protein DCZ03_00925 [Gammaproteobacteria bacterium]|nr:hypothetical protein [Gammaproteobacteria bacterium]
MLNRAAATCRLKYLYQPLLTTLFALMVVQPAFSEREPLPLWDAGAAFGATRIPHYRGSGQYNTWAAPGPLFNYRGDILKVDDDGVRTEFRINKDTEIDISFGANLPVSAEDRGVRADMGRLEATAETGPSLQMRVWQHATDNREFWIKLPVRAQFVVDSDGIHPQGLIFAPYVQFIARDIRASRWGYSLSLGPLYADNEYYEHFYDVPLEYVTAVRPLFKTGGGYGGSRIILNLYNAAYPISYGVFLRWDTLKDSEFEESPLVEERENLSVGFGISWHIWSSKKTVPIR